MLAEAYTHTGLVRQNNEDAFLLLPDINLFAVADGMGGHAAGEVASNIAVDTLADLIGRSDQTKQPGKTLSAAVATANEKIFTQAKNQPSQQGMGTTLSALWVPGSAGRAYLAHVGDSRIYLYRHHQIKLITADHSFVSEMVRNGNITAEEAEHHPRRNMLTRALGAADSVEVDLLEMDLLPGDMLLGCTDGLSSLVSHQEIANILKHSGDLTTKLQQMVDLALARGGHDNVTALLVYNS